MEKVTPNQPFTPKADDWNAFIDAANYVKNREMIEQVSNRDDQSASGIVMVQNVTDQTFPIFSCLYLSDLAISPEDSSEDDYFFQPIVFAASNSPDPAIPSNSKLCIIQQPLKPDEIGKAMVIGVTHAKVNILNLQHTFAVPDSNGTMKSADEGEIQILWQEGESTGQQQCVLQIGNAAASAATESTWHVDITEEEGGTILVNPILYRAEDDGYAVIFRGEKSYVQSETYRLQPEDLNSTLYVSIVKTDYYGASKVIFMMALTDEYNSRPDAGYIHVARIRRINGQISVTMLYDRMFEWPDPFWGHGQFTADMMFSGIQHSEDEIEIWPFMDFVEEAEQKLAISPKYGMIFKGGYTMIHANTSLLTLPENSDQSRLIIYLQISINQYGAVQTKQYSIIPVSGYSDNPPFLQSHDNLIQIPVTILSDKRYAPVRSIITGDQYNGVSFPELWVNPLGLEWASYYCPMIWCDYSAQTVNVRVRMVLDGAVYDYDTALSAPFSAFSSAEYELPLTISAYYNSTSRTWSQIWFSFSGAPLTTKPSDQIDDHLITHVLGYVRYDSATSTPIVTGQNFSRYIYFSSAQYRYQELTPLIAQLSAIQQTLTEMSTSIGNMSNQLSNHEIRIQNLESRS